MPTPDNTDTSHTPLRPGTANRIVMFADMLGFGALTEQNELEPQTLGGEFRLEQIFAGIVSGRNPLTHAFNTFHRSLSSALQLAQLRYSLTSISFSDSAFVAGTRLHEVVSMAAYHMSSVIRSGVAMRVGIAYGTFEAVQFRSDISLHGGDHAAQFLGTGVTRAHATETCGIKGCRILLHPSAAALLHDPVHNPLQTSEAILTLPCAAEESLNRAGVLHEINYWPTSRKDDEGTWRGLQTLWDTAPAKEEGHYLATAAAANRMRVMHGQPGITDLRRRVIPRLRKTRT